MKKSEKSMKNRKKSKNAKNFPPYMQGSVIFASKFWKSVPPLQGS